MTSQDDRRSMEAMLASIREAIHRETAMQLAGLRRTRAGVNVAHDRPTPAETARASKAAMPETPPYLRPSRAASFRDDIADDLLAPGAEDAGNATLEDAVGNAEQAPDEAPLSLSATHPRDGMVEERVSAAGRSETQETGRQAGTTEPARDPEASPMSRQGRRPRPRLFEDVLAGRIRPAALSSDTAPAGGRHEPAAGLPLHGGNAENASARMAAAPIDDQPPVAGPPSIDEPSMAMEGSLALETMPAETLPAETAERTGLASSDSTGAHERHEQGAPAEALGVDGDEAADDLASDILWADRSAGSAADRSITAAAPTAETSLAHGQGPAEETVTEDLGREEASDTWASATEARDPFGHDRDGAVASVVADGTFDSGHADPAAETESLVAPEVEARVAQAFGRLDAEGMIAALGGPGALEQIVREELRPLLRDWLNAHLPAMVERIVREEIRRIAHGGRSGHLG